MRKDALLSSCPVLSHLDLSPLLLPGDCKSRIQQGPAGQDQDAKSATACKQCTAGHSCTKGSAKPTPCPAGTASAALRLTSESGCVDVLPGFWAPLGCVACVRELHHHLLLQMRDAALSPLGGVGGPAVLLEGSAAMAEVLAASSGKLVSSGRATREGGSPDALEDAGS